MSSHSNSGQAHDFYYHGVDEGGSGDYAQCSVSYEGDTARSYYTAVAKVIPAKGVRRKDVRTSSMNSGLTLLSMWSMSNTTSRHISLLHRASPFETVLVPLRRGDRDFTPNDLRDQFLEELTYYSAQLNVAVGRNTFVGLLESLKRLRAAACEEWAKPLRDRRFRKFLSVDVSKAAEELKARNRRLAAKRAAETKALFAKYAKDPHSYLELVHVLFDPDYHSPDMPIDRDRRAAIRSKLNLDPGAAYVWLEGDVIRTSKNVSVGIEEAKVLMRLWAAGKDMRTMRVGLYTIVSYTGNTIQIGCHRIPRENMLALYEEVMGTPFPGKARPAAEVA